MDEDNPYYAFFKDQLALKTNGQSGGAYYDGSIGHVYAAPRGFRHGRSTLFHTRDFNPSTQGMGFTNILGRLLRFSTPILKFLGQKAVNVASNVARDAVEGENVLVSAKKHLGEEVKNLIDGNKNPVTPTQPSSTHSATFGATTRKRKRATSTKAGKTNKRSRTYPALQLMH